MGRRLLQFFHQARPFSPSEETGSLLTEASSTGINSAEARARVAGHVRRAVLTERSDERAVGRAHGDRAERPFIRKVPAGVEGIPVFGGELTVQTDPCGGVMRVNGKTTPPAAMDTTPSVDASVATEKAIQFACKNYRLDRAALTGNTPELWIYNPSLLHSGPNVNRLVWRLDVKAKDLRPVDELVLVDAHSGVVALHFNQTGFANTKHREIYDDNNTPTDLLPGDIGFPGALAREEDQPVILDTDVNNAYD